jgi:hypothetical protein
MVKKDGAETRRERISQIAKDLQAAFYEKKENGEKEELSLSKFISLEMYRTGLTRDKVIEYLGIIEAMGQCEIDSENDKIRKPEF